MKLVDTYLEDLYINEEINNLQELDLKAFMNKFKSSDAIKSFISKLKTSVNIKNPEASIKKVSQMLKPINVKLSSINKFMSRQDKGYIKRKQLTSKILSNSIPEAKKESIDIASSFLSLGSLLQKKGSKINPDSKIKSDIKKFVNQSRKFADQFEKDEEMNDSGALRPYEYWADYAIGWTVFVFLLTILTAGLVMTSVVTYAFITTLPFSASLLSAALIIAFFGITAIFLTKLAIGV